MLPGLCREDSGLSAAGPQVRILRDGDPGRRAEGRLIEKPAYRVDPVDTTGCGDVFHSGFIYGLLQGWEYEKCLDFAGWAAAMVSLKMGGRSGIPTPQQIREKGF